VAQVLLLAEIPGVIKTNRVKEEQMVPEAHAKFNVRVVIGCILMTAGTLIMIYVQHIWFAVAFLLWSVGAAIAFPALRRLSRMPSLITLKQKNKRLLLIIMINTATAAVAPFMLHAGHPRLSMKVMFIVSGITWLLANVCACCIFKKMNSSAKHE
jgi:hypothetical protein